MTQIFRELGFRKSYRHVVFVVFSILMVVGCSSVPSDKFISTDGYKEAAYQACIKTLGAKAEMSQSSLESICHHHGDNGLMNAKFQYKMYRADDDYKSCQGKSEVERDKCFVEKQKAYYNRIITMMENLK